MKDTGPLRRVDWARPGNDRQGDPDKGFEAYYTGAWWLLLSCGHTIVRPRVGFDGPLVARCEPTCSITRRLYGRHVTPSGQLKDTTEMRIENIGPLSSTMSYKEAAA